MKNNKQFIIKGIEQTFLLTFEYVMRPSQEGEEYLLTIYKKLVEPTSQNLIYSEIAVELVSNLDGVMDMIRKFEEDVKQVNQKMLNEWT